MKEERMEILNMLKDGTISAEEAERLLQALESGEQRERKSDGKRYGRKRPIHSGSGFGVIEELGRTVAGIGKSIGSAVSGAVGSASFDDINPEKYDAYENVPFTHETEIPANATLIIRQRKNRSAHSADIILSKSDSNTLTINADRDEAVQLRVKGDEYVLIIDTDAEVYVPESCAGVSVGLLDGDISVTNFPVPMSVSTMSGDIALSAVTLDGKCATMSGDVSARIVEFAASKSEITSMSGDITLAIPNQWDGVIEATTLSGDISTDMPEAEIEDQSHVVGTSVRLRVGSGQTTDSIKCATMSGDVSIQESKRTETTHAYSE